MAEIPQLEFISQTDVFLALGNKRHRLSYHLTYCLKHAENVRKFAVSILVDLNKGNALIAGNEAHVGSLKGAEEAINQLEIELKIRRFF